MEKDDIVNSLKVGGRNKNNLNLPLLQHLWLSPSLQVTIVYNRRGTINMSGGNAVKFKMPEIFLLFFRL